jgi:hypothetical protein
MIKYALACDHAHAFEGWFGSSADYDDQASRGMVDCPVCGSNTVKKQIMAPAVAGTRKRDLSAPDPKMRAMMMDAMGKVRKHVEDNFDYVGDTFAKEARAIHDGKSEERGIYGEASPKEVKSLVEDGVKIAPLPPKPPTKEEIN